MASEKRSRSANDFVKITDDAPLYPLDQFCVPHHYVDDLDSILIPHGMILNRVEKMALNIFKEFQNQPLTVLCVLKGGHQFFADLVEQLKRLNVHTPQPVPLSIDFIRVKSYHNTESTGSVQVIGGDDLTTLRDKNVLIVEDIIDTGNTMTKLLEVLKQYQPRAVRVASLFLKRTPKSNGYIPDYTGFEIPDHFIVGYCLDLNEHFRDLNHVCIINEHGKAKYLS
eukprot:m.59800 g.59800  ORF g.59800 m.59800 type:complete len:225 (+) comp13612_c0_seq1:63-737(+)